MLDEGCSERTRHGPCPPRWYKKQVRKYTNVNRLRVEYTNPEVIYWHHAQVKVTLFWVESRTVTVNLPVLQTVGPEHEK